LVNRVGDVCFLLGIFWMWSTLGTISFAGISETLAGRSPELAFGTLSAIALLLAIGASGKSAQLPLYVWLPDAMEGPTPVSALIHAATMVTAGIYVIARSSALYSLTPQVSTILLVAGALTAFIAATIACVQNDIKRVLAYSTVSQLGFMTMALGAGAYWVAMFHLFTHAFFKALLFLGAGNVLHATHEQDMRRIGGLRTAMPWTFRLMTIGTLAIAGLPPLAGFFSKDEILIALWASPQSSTLIFAIALFTAALTAYYMFRMMRLTFFGMPQSETHAHEASRAMLLPLGILAIGSIVTGWPYARFHHWIAPALRDRYSEPHNLTTALTFAAVSTMAVIVGFALSRFEVPEPLAAVFRRGWFIHDLYNVVFVRGLALTGGRVLNAIDRAVVDGGVNGTALLTRAFSSFLSLWDRYVVDGIVRAISTIVTLSSYPIRLLQTGSVQTYALAVAVAIFAMISLYLTRL
ncbi:MAG TPA: NADH-quinone oxidoreductase subunit L, partial [Bryobacteraceae bacterium]|nr:NADH-quinone oxidoreductase subunit L [Bryobacteraceae bacterium]